MAYNSDDTSSPYKNKIESEDVGSKLIRCMYNLPLKKKVTIDLLKKKVSIE